MRGEELHGEQRHLRAIAAEVRLLRAAIASDVARLENAWGALDERPQGGRVRRDPQLTRGHRISDVLVLRWLRRLAEIKIPWSRWSSRSLDHLMAAEKDLLSVSIVIRVVLLVALIALTTLTGIGVLRHGWPLALVIAIANVIAVLWALSHFRAYDMMEVRLEPPKLRLAVAQSALRDDVRALWRESLAKHLRGQALRAFEVALADPSVENIEAVVAEMDAAERASLSQSLALVMQVEGALSAVEDPTATLISELLEALKTEEASSSDPPAES